MSTRSFGVLALSVVAAGCGLMALHVLAPSYLLAQGFPLDDAWIHAVYAREVARSGMLAYNPGVPATGETSPLWAVALAIPHLVSSSTSTVVVLTKAIGFLLHAGSAALLALTCSAALGGRSRWWPVTSGGLVALHPDLLAASVSGMEVPLATFVIASSALAVIRRNELAVAGLSAAAFMARPESAAFAVLLPFIYWFGADRRVAFRLTAAATLGALVSLAALGVRNQAVSGLWLPATFYAKATVTSPFDISGQIAGFTGVLGTMPLMHLPVVLIAAALSMALLARGSTSTPGRMAAALCLSGLLFCCLEFALIWPSDPRAFYHQRYVLPAIMPIAVALPLLAREFLQGVCSRAAVVAYAVLAVTTAAALATAMPARFRQLSNDARNIDDVQVAFGRSLASAPATANAWVVDAGASRYFGNAFVVDLMALNTFELLDSRGQAYLDRHPPGYLDSFQLWSRIAMDDGPAVRASVFEASTAYTVTSYDAMRRHTLMQCEPAGRAGRITVRRRTYTFRCAGGPPADE